MDIHEIKERTKKSAPYFFSEDTLRFFGQSLESFNVELEGDGRYRVSAPIKDRDGKRRGETVRYFNPATNELERE